MRPYERIRVLEKVVGVPQQGCSGLEIPGDIFEVFRGDPHGGFSGCENERYVEIFRAFQSFV